MQRRGSELCYLRAFWVGHPFALPARGGVWYPPHDKERVAPVTAYRPKERSLFGCNVELDSCITYRGAFADAHEGRWMEAMDAIGFCDDFSDCLLPKGRPLAGPGEGGRKPSDRSQRRSVRHAPANQVSAARRRASPCHRKKAKLREKAAPAHVGRNAGKAGEPDGLG